jgi:hypothetical protein
VVPFHVARQADCFTCMLSKRGEVLVGDGVDFAIRNEDKFPAALDASQRAVSFRHLHLRVFVHVHHLGVAGAACTVADHAGHCHGGG